MHVESFFSLLLVCGHVTMIDVVLFVVFLVPFTYGQYRFHLIMATVLGIVMGLSRHGLYLGCLVVIIEKII